MYSRILVPLALASAGDSDLPIAAARKLASPGAEIVLLHVIEDVAPQAAAFLPPQYLADMRRDRVEDLARRGAGVDRVTVEVADGNAAATILERAEALGCDCIVIASHRPGLRDWFLGSTAARVVRHARCAVLVVR